MTAEAVEEMGLRIGDEAVGVVKATNVIVEIPSPRRVADDASVAAMLVAVALRAHRLHGAGAAGTGQLGADGRARAPAPTDAPRPPASGAQSS